MNEYCDRCIHVGIIAVCSYCNDWNKVVDYHHKEYHYYIRSEMYMLMRLYNTKKKNNFDLQKT